MLVAGEGGQGKTRLARQFAAQARQAGWAAGFLAARTSGPAPADGRDQLQSTVELARRVREATRPVLLVADYAETRPDEITALADILASSPLAHPVRVAAAVPNGRGLVGQPDRGPRPAPHAPDQPGAAHRGRRRRGSDAYAAAVTGLARHLAALPDSPAEREPGRPWSALAEQLAAPAARA